VTTSTTTLVSAGTYRVVECAEKRTLAIGLSLNHAHTFIRATRSQRPWERLDIRTEWVEAPADEPIHSGESVPGFADIPLDDLVGHRR
jgi:hypothetical protein